MALLYREEGLNDFFRFFFLIGIDVNFYNMFPLYRSFIACGIFGSFSFSFGYVFFTLGDCLAVLEGSFSAVYEVDVLKTLIFKEIR